MIAKKWWRFIGIIEKVAIKIIYNLNLTKRALEKYTQKYWHKKKTIEFDKNIE